MTTDPSESAPLKIPQSDLPNIAAPTERKSDKLNVWSFAKNVLIFALVTKLSAAAGWIAGRYTPPSMLPKSLQKYQVVEMNGVKKYQLAMYAAAITGTIGGYYEGWRLWRKEKGKQLDVKDIHKEIYTELDPKILQAEVEQNERIQNGIKTLLQKGPQSSIAEALLKDNTPNAAIAR